MLTVLHLITGLEAGGAQHALLRLVAHTDRRRFRSVVVSLTDTGVLGPAIKAAGADLHTLRLPGGAPTPSGLLRLLRLLRDVRPDIVQTWLYHADLLGLLLKPLANMPHLLWNLRCSDMDLPPGRMAVLRLLGRLSRVPEVVVVNSRAGQLVHQKIGYRPRRWELIPNGFDIADLKPDPVARRELRAELGCKPGTIAIGMPARVHPMKDHATFLAAAARLARSRPEASFVLIGAGAEPASTELRELIPAELSDRVMLLGERADMARLYPALDIVSLTSAYGEGFPNVLGEAMACGVPCVATDVGDAAVLVGTTGVVVQPRDPEALAAAWDRVIVLGEDGRRALGQEGRSRIEAHYAIGAVVARYEALYQEIATPGAAPRIAARMAVGTTSKLAGH
jgi:glycosyltransferase involved in cell wall biosynthesis